LQTALSHRICEVLKHLRTGRQKPLHKDEGHQLISLTKKRNAGGRPARALRSRAEEKDIGEEIYDLAAEIYPICRSIAGDGVRRTLQILGQKIPLSVREVPTGKQVLDWIIPKEWNIREAYIKNSRGERIIDLRSSNLHVMSYSAPVHAHLGLKELSEHIYTLPEQPDLIPYRTSYYSENWAFCMSHAQFLTLEDDIYEVFIDSDLKLGHLTFGEAKHRGETSDEVLLSAHICHPSLANDNCSGLALLACLANRLASRKTRYTYRFLFAPATIGAITWLAENVDSLKIKHGLVMSCVGDGGGPTYKSSRVGDAMIDRAMKHVLTYSFPHVDLLDFIPYGYDERQYCSPGFNLPVGLFQRSRFGAFPEYHTSADNLDFIKPEHLASSFNAIWDAIDVLESNRRLLNTKPYGEPQLGRYDLYSPVGGDKRTAERNMAMLWILNLSDGQQTLLDIAERSKLPFKTIRDAAEVLESRGLLSECDAN